MKVAIVGGGIGGFALALSLDAAGIHDVDIYESASAIRALGVGITVLPHAMRELTELGLLDDLLAAGIPTSEWMLASKHGQRIWVEPRGVAAGYRWPQVSIHRGDLITVLHRAVQGRLGLDRIHPGHHLSHFSQGEASTVSADFVDRATGATVSQVEADLLVGCDGVHSSVRQALYPDEGPPGWNGNTLWRGVTEGAPFLSGRTMVTAGHWGQQVVFYSMSKRHGDQGRALINWVAQIKTAEGQPMSPQDWDFTASPEEVAEPFAGFRWDYLDMPALVRGAEVVYKYPMVDRDPLPSWDFGRVTLLGDAAHPRYPAGANGASQAILDARFLAWELALQPSVEAAVTAYDAQRRPATAAVQQANRGLGPVRVLNIVARSAHRTASRTWTTSSAHRSLSRSRTATKAPPASTSSGSTTARRCQSAECCIGPSAWRRTGSRGRPAARPA